MAEPNFKTLLEFYKENLTKNGFSPNLVWIFRENVIVHSGKKARYRFYINPMINPITEDKLEKIYNYLKSTNGLIFIYTFIKDIDRTYVTIASDDYDFEDQNGDLKMADCDVLFGYSRFWDFANTSDEIEVVNDINFWNKLKELKFNDIGPFDYFYCFDYFKRHYPGNLS